MSSFPLRVSLIVCGLVGANLYGLLPRVERCPDGSYCCDTDPKCCLKGAGTFLDGRGNIVSTSSSSSSTPLPTSDLSTSIPTAAVTNSPSSSGRQPDLTGSPSSTTLPNSAQTPVPNRTSFPVAAQVGIGIAVVFSFLSFVVLSVLFYQKMRRRRQPKPPQTPPVGVHLVDSVPRYELHEDYVPAEMPAGSSRRSKLSFI